MFIVDYLDVAFVVLINAALNSCQGFLGMECPLSPISGIMNAVWLALH